MATDHTIPTPSQLKIDGMPETEVLRIEGNVVIPKEVGQKGLYSLITKTLTTAGYWHTLSVVPQDSPTGMRLYRVEDVEYKDKQISMLQNVVDSLQETGKSNDKAFSDLAEQLRQEKEAKNRIEKAFNILEQKYVRQDLTIDIQLDKIAALELRLRVKDSPIKAGLKRICKWFKSTVNQ